MTTDERMKKMEGQLARVRWFNRCLIVCIVLSLGVWFIWKSFGPKQVWAQSSGKVIRANAFFLEDENGKDGASLVMTDDGPMLGLLDENGQPRILLSMMKGGPCLMLTDKSGKGDVTLNVRNGRSSLP